MSREQRIVYNNPPLAGRPPFATDEPESIYQTGPSVQARYRQVPPPSPQTSAFNTHDNRFDESGNQDGRDPFKNPAYVRNGPGMNQDKSIPLAAPRPGYAAPVAALNLNRPSPTATPVGRQFPSMAQIHSPVSTVPSTPHPLQPPMTPIAPAFIRPSPSPSPRDVSFNLDKAILRGDKEETLLPKRGERGDDFWRRFSMVVKEDNKEQHKSSRWLTKTQSGSTRLSRSVWIVAIILILCIAAACVLGWYVGHNSSSHSSPKSVGGKYNDPSTPFSSSSSLAGDLATSTVFHVSPTLTLNDKREPLPSHGAILDTYVIRAHRRSHLNRSHMH